MNPIRIVQLGLGPIGQACVRELARRPAIELAGGVDVDPAKVGRDLGEVCGLERPLGTTVRAAPVVCTTRSHSSISGL